MLPLIFLPPNSVPVVVAPGNAAYILVDPTARRNHKEFA
jgi:hypothetical protein